MVDFSVKADFSSVEKMLNKFGDNAVKEYRNALKDTSVYGLREIKNATPVRTGTAKNYWKWAFKGELITGIVNDVGYINDIDQGWSRTGPIVPNKAKALVFQVGKQTAKKSSTATLYKRYASAMKSLKGKGLSAKEKSQRATEKSGVVVVKNVKTPASYKGKHFIQPTVDRMANYLDNAIGKANERLFR